MPSITITITDGKRTVTHERDSDMLASTVQKTMLQWSIFDMTPQAFNAVCLHTGPQRAINDHANQAGADATPEAKIDLGRKRIAAFADPEWFPNAREGGTDPMLRHRLAAFAALIKAAGKLPKSPAIFTKRGAVSPDAFDWLSKKLDSQSDDVKAQVESAAEEAFDRAVAKAKAAKAERERVESDAKEGVKSLTLSI